MHSVKHANVTLTASTLKTVPDVSVGVSFALNGNGMTFLSLRKQRPCTDNSHESHKTILAYALFASISRDLRNTPADLVKTRCTAVHPSFTEGIFGISWSTQNNLTSVRKTLSKVFKLLVPGHSSFYRTYEILSSILGQKAKREEFETAAKEISASIAKHVDVFVVGKVNLGDDPKVKLMEVLEVACKHLVVENKNGKMMTKTKAGDKMPNALYVSGWKQALVQIYICQASCDLSEQAGDMLMLADASVIGKTLRQLGDEKRVKVFVERKLSTVNATTVLAYTFLAHGLLPAELVVKFASEAPTASALGKVLVGTLA